MTNSKPSILHRGWSVFGKLVAGTRKGPTRDRVRMLKKFQKQIDVRFTDLSLLEQALTHRSYSHVTSQTRNDSNERMEFLGDSVLGLSVSQFLYLQFPDRSEGALSKMKSLLVSKKILSQVSREIGLGEFLLLSGEESEMGGRDRASILADSFESVIGAIYLDQGYRAANKFIRVFLLGQIVDILKDEEHTNYKSLLQEYVQSRRLSHPLYRVHAEAGPEHEKEFAIEVVVKGEVWGTGRGKSKKEAEQNAARSAMEMRLKRDASRKPRTAAPRAGAKVAEKVESPASGASREHGIHASREKHRAKRRSQSSSGRGEGERKSKAAGARRRTSDRTEKAAASSGAAKEAAPRERSTSGRRSSRRTTGARERTPREKPARETVRREKPETTERETPTAERPTREKRTRETGDRSPRDRERRERDAEAPAAAARAPREPRPREAPATEPAERRPERKEAPPAEIPAAESKAPAVEPAESKAPAVEPAERPEKETPTAASPPPSADEKTSFRRRKRRSAPGRR